MTKAQARKCILEYLRLYNIPHQLFNDSSGSLSDIADMPIYIRFHVDQAPDHIAECSIWFYEGEIEVRGYYSENAASWVRQYKGNIPEVLSVINFINARVFLGDLLFTPRLYITADGQPEFAITTIIPYRFFESATLETLEYITCYYPELLGKLSFPLFCTLIESITPDMAIYHIRTDLLEEENAQIEWHVDD